MLSSEMQPMETIPFPPLPDLAPKPRRRQPERREQAAIVKLLRSVGAAVYVLGTTRRKGDWQGTMQTAGVPDLLCFIQADVTLLLIIEVKAKGGRRSREQDEFKTQCDAANVHHVTGGQGDVIKWLIDHGIVRETHVAHYRVSRDVKSRERA